MSAKWRPDGWKNPFDMKLSDGEIIPRWKRRHDAFEAGADAMLKALRNKTDLMVIPSTTCSKGKFVFIPDDKEAS